MKIVYAFFIGLCGSGSYAIINMLFFHMLTQRLALLALLPCFLLDLSLVCLIMTRKRVREHLEVPHIANPVLGCPILIAGATLSGVFVCNKNWSMAQLDVYKCTLLQHSQSGNSYPRFITAQ